MSSQQPRARLSCHTFAGTTTAAGSPTTDLTRCSLASSLLSACLRWSICTGFVPVEPQCLRLCSDSCCSKGYVHRDIKPENVLFTSDGHCKMVIARWIEAVQTTKTRCNVTRTQADFGLSTSEADRSVTKARTGQLQVSRAACRRSLDDAVRGT